MLVAGTCSLVLPSMKEVMHLILTQLLKTHGGKRNTKATQPRLSQGLRKITASRKDKRSTSQYRKEQAEKITRKKVVSNLMTMSRMTMFRAKHHQDPQVRTVLHDESRIRLYHDQTFEHVLCNTPCDCNDMISSFTFLQSWSEGRG
mmetsp:Transcript_53516/g.160139  ORF Transcript_53516/g.160139 Transcript_53516/m.160139 type:complete len:146 (-) Transcript_53516:462-899(-)